MFEFMVPGVALIAMMILGIYLMEFFTGKTRGFLVGVGHFGNF